jgi:hypothetical protein
VRCDGFEFRARALLRDCRPGASEALYPVACAPQAWAAGSTLLLLQACLGMCVSAQKKEVWFKRPTLPHMLREVRIENLRLGDSNVTIAVRRNDHGVSIEASHEGGIRVYELL